MLGWWLGKLFLQREGELGFAGVGGIIEDFALAVAFGGVEVEAVFDAVGDAGDAGFAVDVGADFEIEFADAEESVGDVDFDFGVVDGSVVGIGDSEVGGAGADGAVDAGDGVGVGSLGRGEGEQKQ